MTKSCALLIVEFNPVNLVLLLLSIQSIRLTTLCHIFVNQLMTDFDLFESHLLSQSGNNTVLLMLFNGRLFCISTAALITNIPLTSWGNEMKFTKKIEKELIYSTNLNL
jgi:hypothetical protein